MKRFAFAAEITLTVDDIGTQQKFVFATYGFATKSADSPANTAVLEYLDDPGTLRRELFSGARVGGPVRPSFGQLVLTNHEGVLDDWMTYGTAGGLVTVRYGEPGAAYPAAWTTVYVANAYSLIVDFDRVRVLLRDPLYKLEEPIVNEIFLGTGGLEGTGIAQRKKQMVFGRPGFFPPVLVDSQKQIYFVQSNAADSRAFQSTNPPLYLAFEGGRGLNFGGYYSSEADLLTGPEPAAGFFKVYGPGVDGLTRESTETTGPLYFRMGSPPAFEMRFPSLGLLKNTPADSAATWNFRDLATRAGIDVVMAPGSYIKNAGNYLVDGDQTYLDVMTDACTASFSAYGFDRLGRMFTLDLKDPTEGADPSVAEFNTHNAKGISRQPVPGGEAPIWTVAVSVGRTWPTNSLRTSLSPAERDIFERSPWQSTFTGSSYSVRLANPGAEATAVQIQGNELVGEGDKTAFVRRFIYLFGSRRELITLTTQLTPEIMALELHQKVTLKMARFNSAAGRLFRIITLDLNCKARTVTLGLWGGPAGPLDAVLGGGAGTPGGGTGQDIAISGAGRLGPFQSIFYGRNIGGGGGGQSTLANWGQFAYGRVIIDAFPQWDSSTVAAPLSISDSDRKITLPVSNSSVGITVRAKRGITTGKWYWEVIVTSVYTAGGGSSMIGMVDSGHPGNKNISPQGTGNTFGWLKSGSFWVGGVAVAGGRFTFNDGDVAQFAFDASVGKMWIGSNGIWQTAAPGGTADITGLSTSETYYPACTPWSSGASETVELELRGAGGLAYPLPSGYSAYTNP